MLRSTPARPRTLVRRTGAPVLLALAFTALAGSGAATALPTAAQPSGPCTDGEGVTVVVDLTDLGGEVEVGCASGAATGTEALQAAGFTDTRDASGMICAVDGLPDPCPTTFEGSFWSYWSGGEDGTWQTYMEGSDTAVPEPGGVEGWRYNDGSAGPTVSPAEALDLAAPAPEDAEADAADDDASQTTVTQGPPVEAPDGVSPVLLAGAGVLAVLAVGAVLLRRRSDQHGPRGQD